MTEDKAYIEAPEPTAEDDAAAEEARTAELSKDKRYGAKGVLDAAATTGLGVLSAIPFAKQGLAHGLSYLANVPTSEIYKQFDQLAAERPTLDLVGKGAGAVLGGAVAAPATYGAAAAIGAVQGASEVAQNLETTPLDVEKAMWTIGLSSLFGVATKGVGSASNAVNKTVQAANKLFNKFADNVPVQIATAATTGPLGYLGLKAKQKALNIVAGAFDSAMESEVAGFLKENSGALTHGAIGAGSRYAGTLSKEEAPKEDIDELAQNPQVTTNLAEYLKDLPPKVSDGIQARVQAAAITYQEAKTKNGSPSAPYLYDPEPILNDTARDRIARVKAALDNPLKIIDDPDPDAIKAVQSVYPEISQAIGRSVMAKLADKPDISYGTKIQASKLIGMPLDGTMEPQFGFAMQQRLQAERAKKQNSGQQTSARTAAAVRKANRATLTRAQILNAGDEGS